jgi:hypothetical protein
VKSAKQQSGALAKSGIGIGNGEPAISKRDAVEGSTPGSYDLLESSFVPIANPNILQLSTATLTIQRIRPLIFAVDFPKEAFEFSNLCFRDIRPHGVHRKMGPQLSLSLAVGVSLEASTYSSTTICHSDIHHIELRDTRAMPVQGVDSSEPPWH